MKKLLLIGLLISGFCFGQKIGNWYVNEKEDPITDERILTLYTNSKESQKFNYGRKTGKLLIRSTNRNLELFVNWGGFITTQSTKVTYQIGDNEPKSEYWTMSTDHKATFSRRSIKIVKEMRYEKRSLFRVTPYGDSPITYSFDITGLDSIINQYTEDFVSFDEGDMSEASVRFIPYDDPPKPLTPIKPKYPEEAKEMGIEGTVIVQVFVNEKGRVTYTTIMKGFPDTGLNEAAIEAIKKTQFKPAMQGNKKVGVWISIPVNFRLGGTTSIWNTGGGSFEEKNISFIMMTVAFILIFGLIL